MSHGGWRGEGVAGEQLADSTIVVGTWCGRGSYGSAAPHPVAKAPGEEDGDNPAQVRSEQELTGAREEVVASVAQDANQCAELMSHISVVLRELPPLLHLFLLI